MRKDTKVFYIMLLTCLSLLIAILIIDLYIPIQFTVDNLYILLTIIWVFIIIPLVDRIIDGIYKGADNNAMQEIL